MVSLPSYAHTNPVKAVPGEGQVVRAVDPTQSKPSPTGPGTSCTDFGWGAPAGTGLFEHPCAVWLQVDQPVDKTSTLAVYGPNDDSAAIAGTVAQRDTSSNSTNRNQVATAVPGPDTIILFPNAPLPAGTYLARALIKDDSRFGGHGHNCTSDETGPAFNCIEWRFTVAPTPATPTITSPADGDALGSRLVNVTGTAEPHSTVEILDAASEVIAETITDGEGNFEILAPAADGANTITAKATSTPSTTSERKWATWDACRDAAIQTGEDEDVDELILEEECGVAPTEVLPPVASSAARSFTADATPDTEAPTLTLTTAPDTIQAGESEALIVGTATDNDQVESLQVVVTDPASNAVTAFTVTFDKSPMTDWSVSLHDPGYYTVSITALDRAGNASTTITTTYLSTTGNALA